MAANNVYIPYLNPIKLVKQDFSLSDRYHQAAFDEAFYIHQAYSYEYVRPYYQPFQNNDKINFQLVSDFGGVQARLINCKEQIIVTGTVAPIVNSFYNLPDIAYGCSIDLTTVPTGYYFVSALVGLGASQVKLISEPIFIDADIPDTLVFDYTHRQNKYGTIFQNGETFSFRCPASITNFKPGINQVVDEDQEADLVTLSANAYRAFELSIGDPYGAPNWVADKMNRIYGLSKVLTDGQQYVRGDGAKMEAKRIENYTMAGWTMEIREAQAKNGYTISNNIPAGSEVFSVFPKDPKIFGPIGYFPTNDALILKVE